MPANNKISIFVAVIICFLLVANGTLVLYACLLWPRQDGQSDFLFITGIATFVVCFTLPFLIIGGYMLWSYCSPRSPCTFCNCKLARYRCCCCNKEAELSQSQSQLQNLHSLDLLPSTFVETNFGSLIQSSLVRGSKSASIHRTPRQLRRSSSTGPEFSENHYKRVIVTESQKKYNSIMVGANWSLENPTCSSVTTEL